MSTTGMLLLLHALVMTNWCGLSFRLLAKVSASCTTLMYSLSSLSIVSSLSCLSIRDAYTSSFFLKVVAMLKAADEIRNDADMLGMRPLRQDLINFFCPSVTWEMGDEMGDEHEVSFSFFLISRTNFFLLFNLGTVILHSTGALSWKARADSKSPHRRRKV
mmetsp:Transcript_8558/g.10987  ORF Transcript_8558/g.10987 Transcript_8558/m.10987 type:complete len:161 (+) Transcript_8558:794-1276(+)